MEPGPAGSSQISVVVVDDEELVHWGMRALLRRQPWAAEYFAAPTLQVALAVLERHAPHVAVIDLGLLGDNPANACHRLLMARPGLRILLLSAADAMSLSTLRAYGAVGFVSRAWSARDLLRAIQIASARGAAAPLQRPTDATLSARQQEILHLIAAGETNSEIARRLFLSQNTVKQHTSALYRKLGVKNRTHAVQAARRRGLIRA